MMPWDYIRVLIFTTAFLFGLFVFGSGGVAANSKSEVPANVQDSVQPAKCTDPRLHLIYDQPVVESPGTVEHM
jgi:hypothetical protein